MDTSVCSSCGIYPFISSTFDESALRFKNAKGTIRISSREEDDGYYILIDDDGIGISEDFNNDGKVHLGIKNTRTRIKLLCTGTLNIKPLSPRGTRCQIFIPKK